MVIFDCDECDELSKIYDIIMKNYSIRSKQQASWQYSI